MIIIFSIEDGIKEINTTADTINFVMTIARKEIMILHPSAVESSHF